MPILRVTAGPDAGREERFSSETLLVGARPRAIPGCRKLRLTDPAVAATHAIVGLGAEGYCLEHYGRRERPEIRINGALLVERHTLADGDAVRLGESALRYERAAGDDHVTALLLLRLRLDELPVEEVSGILDGLEQLAGEGEVETLRRALRARGARSPFGTTTIAQLATYVPNYGYSVGLLELLFERVREDVVRYFARRVARREDAEDLAQDSLTRLLAAVQQRAYKPYFSFRTYLRMVCGGVLYDHFRRAGLRRTELLDEAALPGAGPAADPGERLDLETLIAELRERLGEEAYEVFVLHHVEGRTRKEIAAAVGLSRDTVRKRLEAAQALFARLTGGG